MEAELFFFKYPKSCQDKIPLGIILNHHSRLISAGERVTDNIKNEDEIQVLVTVINTSSFPKAERSAKVYLVAMYNWITAVRGGNFFFCMT